MHITPEAWYKTFAKVSNLDRGVVNMSSSTGWDVCRCGILEASASVLHRVLSKSRELTKINDCTEFYAKPIGLLHESDLKVLILLMLLF